MAVYKILWIPATVGGLKTDEMTKTPAFEKLQAWCEGPIERYKMLLPGKVHATMWVNEEGQIRQMPINKVATALTAAAAATMGTELTQHICGPTVCVINVGTNTRDEWRQYWKAFDQKRIDEMMKMNTVMVWR